MRPFRKCLSRADIFYASGGFPQKETIYKAEESSEINCHLSSAAPQLQNSSLNDCPRQTKAGDREGSHVENTIILDLNHLECMRARGRGRPATRLMTPSTNTSAGTTAELL